ncbi:MAG: cyclic nucleotide-binding domain-containing protein [Betaproteobacteria bacterium]|nr:cyclic nucleotide-binding domain-containing protein [Betaproteobacteria bacterium]
MSDLDFSQPIAPRPAAPPPPPPPPVYNAAMAMEFFKSAGKPEGFEQGRTIFAEDEKGGLLKRAKMYVLIVGEVNMVAQNKVIGTVKAGEVFGEMAVIAQAARTATAVAKSACTVIGLDDKQFLSALQHKPEFALMLMSIMNSRLRNTIARLRASGALHAGAATESTVFDKKLLAGLVRLMQGQEPVRYERGKMIMQEGTAGALMYIVLEGRVAISIKGGLVGHAGPGGVFGEMALVDQSPRAATATAEADCSLLAINRPAFLQLVKTSPAFGAALLAGLAGRAQEMAARNK